MPKADSQEVAGLLREYAQRSALRGGNPYRAKAYARAADSVAALTVQLGTLIAEDRLTEISGVGKSIADIITKLHNTATHPSLEKLRKEIPAGVLELLSSGAPSGEGAAAVQGFRNHLACRARSGRQGGPHQEGERSERELLAIHNRRRFFTAVDGLQLENCARLSPVPSAPRLNCRQRLGNV
jgi:hypothetical protein